MTESQTYPELSEALRARIVSQTAEAVRATYVFEAEANRMADRLLGRHRDGAFDALGTIPELTARLTTELHSVREDLHLVVGPWLPPEQDAEAAVDQAYVEMLRNASRSNYDFRSLEILLGNVGYVDLRSFCPASMAGNTATAAMQFLAHTDALIFDLRDNGGGDDLVQLLQSYLFAEPTHMLTQRYRPERIHQVWTYAHVPGPRFPNHPVYILISRTTFSAAEDFSFTLQRQGRAVLVGEQTRGGAHPVEFYRFPELCLELMIPNGCSVDPATGDNWEETGVVPDVATSADDALDVAHELALRKLLESEGIDQATRAFRQWALESIQARRSPVAVPADTLPKYAGQYGATVRVYVDGDSLMFCWGERRVHKLTPLGHHRFEFDRGTQRATFQMADSTVAELLYQLQDGSEWRMPRVE